MNEARVGEAVIQLEAATEASKCHGCGCLHESLSAIGKAYREVQPESLGRAVTEARERLTPVRYDCLGCDVCYPAIAVNALNAIEGGPLVDLALCPTDRVEERPGWPPLPGAYVVNRWAAPVAVCTLTDENLAKALSQKAGPEVSLVGTLDTENLGIERVVTNVLANPNVRAIVLCGRDSKQAVGHLPGQSLLALAKSGVDERGRIIGAKGKRPVLKNISREAVEHFRRTVSIVDLVGVVDTLVIGRAILDAAATSVGPTAPFAPERAVKPIRGSIPDRMIPDPAGYFVVYADRGRKLLSVEHYTNEGVLDSIVEGLTAAEVYCPLVEAELLSRLDHAAYLGRELARAERALATGESYVQDAAPEKRPVKPTVLSIASRPAATGCGCEPSDACGETK